MLRAVTEPCFYCDGAGVLKSRTSVAYEIYRALVREAQYMEGGPVRLAVHPRVAEALQGPESDMLTELEHRLERQITLESREDFHLEHFEFGSPDGAARQQSA